MANNNVVYNLPLASFTFGKENIKSPISKGNINTLNTLTPNNYQKSNLANKKSLASSIKKKNLGLINNIMDNNNFNLNINNNNFFENNISQYNTSSKEEICELTFGKNNNELVKEPDEQNINQNKNMGKNNHNKNYISSFINNGGINDSFVSVILYSIHHMKLFRKYIINDLNSDKNKNLINFQNSFLYNLREILLQIGKNKYIDIHQFRENLSKQFQNRRKFLLDQPDDPTDLLFVIINAIHSNSIQFSLNEISDENCAEKCFSHKFIWLDLSRIDECKCKGTTKRLFSNHNYITDIPMDKIFNLMNNNKNKNNNEEFLLHNNNQKLFNYYTKLISGIKTNCPVNGQRCPINKTFHKLHLANSPSYLIFNLGHDNNNIYEKYGYSIMNILKCFVLIPNKFDIWDLFELNSKKNKNYFEFIGCILYKISKVYSCAFKNKKGLILYYDCDNQNINNNDDNNNNIEFVSYFDFVVFCIKNGLIPVLLFYQGSFLSHKNNDTNNNMNNYDDILTNEQIINLEKLCNNTDKLYNILQNKLRKKENLISLIKLNKKVKNNSISLNQTNQLNPNKNGINIDEYNCLKCHSKNIITNKLCNKCGYNNNEYLLNIISNKNKKLNNNRKYNNNIPTTNNYSQDKLNINYSFINKNSNYQESISKNDNNNNHMIIHLSKRKKMCVSPDIKHKNGTKLLDNYNYNTYQDSNNLNYMDLPMQYMPKNKEKQNTFTINNNNLNKTEEYISKSNNNLILKEIKLRKNVHTSPRSYRTNNLLNKDNNNINKKYLSIKNKNKVPLNKSNNINNNYDKHNTIKNYENNSTKKMHVIARTLTSNMEMDRVNKSYLNSENNNKLFKKNKKDNNNNVNLRKKKFEQIYKNNIYNNKDIIEMDESDFKQSKRKNLDLNKIYVNGNIINSKKNTINNLNLNYSYNDIHFDKRKNSKKITENNQKSNYNQTTYNNNNNELNIHLNTWICRFCSNINSDDYLYCAVCKKNKEELKKFKTPLNDKKLKFKIKQYKANNSFISNLNKGEKQGLLRKNELNGFNSTKEFKKNKLSKSNMINQNLNNNHNITKQIYNNSRGYIYID